MKKRKIEDNQLAQLSICLLNSTYLCYDGESTKNNDVRKNNTSYSIRKIKNIRGAQPEVFIHTAEITEIKVTLKEIYKKEDALD